jgi:hypothetical protein
MYSVWHSELQNNPFQSKQSKHFHQRNWLTWCETGFNKIKLRKVWSNVIVPVLWWQDPKKGGPSLHDATFIGWMEIYIWNFYSIGCHYFLPGLIALPKNTLLLFSVLNRYSPGKKEWVWDFFLAWLDGHYLHSNLMHLFKKNILSLGFLTDFFDIACDILICWVIVERMVEASVRASPLQNCKQLVYFKI